MSDQESPPQWRQEFDALPPWAQNLLRGLAGCGGYGGGRDAQSFLGGLSDPDRFEVFHIILRRDHAKQWWDGFFEMIDLAKAQTAPWPPAQPPDDMTFSPNAVELCASDDESRWDQPCVFGHRIVGHAVYCHNEAWPDSPRKCSRNRTDYLHEDCPGFVPNPAADAGGEPA